MEIYLSHGASGTAASMKPHVDGLRLRGLSARAVALPKRRAEDAVSVYQSAVAQLSEAIIGGHSYGGRVASLLAARERPAGLVLLSYPLHRPGKGDEWPARTSHWPQIDCPTLLLSGEADPFARLDLLRQALPLLPQAELVTYPGSRHGLTAVLDEVLDRIVEFSRGLG